MTGPEVLDVARDAIVTLVLVASPLMLIGLVVGSLGAVLRSIIKCPANDQDRASIAKPPASDVINAPIVLGESDLDRHATPTGRAIPRHRRPQRKLTRSGRRQSLS